MWRPSHITPVLVVTGGVDTFKMDLHQMWVTYVLGAHVRVVAADIPGTGELTHIPASRPSTEILDQVVAFARTLTTGKTGQLGVSYGGYFSAHAGLTGVVDAAVVVGGPVSSTFAYIDGLVRARGIELAEEEIAELEALADAADVDTRGWWEHEM